MKGAQLLLQFKQAGYDIPAELIDHICVYVDNRVSDVKEMRRLLVEREITEVGAIAHKIYGNASSFGFIALSSYAKGLVESARSLDYLESMKWFDLLSMEVAQMQQVVSQHHRVP